jgi:hypothetical protein
MPRAPGVKQGDFGAPFQQAESGPSAKDSGADDGDMWLGFHAEKKVLDGKGSEFRSESQRSKGTQDLAILKTLKLEPSNLKP